jgi:predicted exporter
MALVAAIVVAGLAIDYGIFAVTALERNDSGFSSDAFSALTLSMLTTLAGAGALLWAEHPALKTVGLVVCSGVAAAYLAAILLLPAAATALRLPTGEANAGGKGN